ncbi:MAG: MBL fold metallo-hydrolase [Candidatus Gygaella obscura]|nr:MBL fold metallo-hydrolase [Candidatus Gygaella obscura]
MHKILLIKQGSTKKERALRKWGLSFLIDEDIIFDTFGARDDFMQQVDSLKIDLRKIRHIVISHDHWDHIDGIFSILAKNKDLTVYLPVHVDKDLKDKIKASGVKLKEVSASLKLKDDIYISKEMFEKKDNGLIFEQCLVIDSASGITLIAGCAHPGIDYMVSEVKKDFKKDIKLLIGGFHLKDTPENKIKLIIDSLIKSGVKEVAPMHCTGKEAVGLFKSCFKDKFIDMDKIRQIVV